MNDVPAVFDSLDDDILGTLRDLHSRTDPVPSGLTDRVKFALTVRELHADVAELVKQPLAVTRDVGTERTDSITFGRGSLNLMVDIAPAGPGHARVDGWVTSGGAVVEAVTPSGSITATADQNGRFVLDRVPHGPVYFVIRTREAESGTGGARPVVTPTVEL